MAIDVELNESVEPDDRLMNSVSAITPALSKAVQNTIITYALIITDTNGKVVSLNKKAEELLGYREQEVIGSSIALFYPENSLFDDKPLLNLQEALINNNYHIKSRRKTKSGDLFNADIYYTALYDDSARHIGYSKSIFEISGDDPEDKEFNKNLEKIDGNISFRKLIENSHAGISLIDKDFNVFYRSSSARTVTGLTNSNKVKESLETIIHPDDRGSLKAVLAESLKHPGIPLTCVYRVKKSEDDFIWLECVITNFLDEPNVNAIVCNYIDITEKKKASDALNSTVEELLAFKYALDQSAIVAITDQKGIITHVNDRFCHISKYTRQELIGSDHRIINSGYHDKAFIKNIWTSIARGKVWHGELKNKAKDGSYYWVDTTIVPFLNTDGKPYQYIAIRSDITQLKQRQAKIEEREKFIETITDNLPAMISYWTKDLTCLFANKPYADWFDKQPAEMRGLSKHDLMNAHEFEQYGHHIDKVLAGLPQSFERAFTKAGASKVYTYTQYIPDKSGDKVMGFYSLIYDVSDIRKAETEIQKKNDQINDLLENITDGFIALDNNLCYTYANKEIGVMTGIDPAKLIGKYIWDAFPEAIGSPTYEAIMKAHRDHHFIANEDYFPGNNLWQENRIYPTETGISVFIRNITGRKTQELQKELTAGVSLLFNEATQLNIILEKVLSLLVNYGSFAIAEVWLVAADNRKLNLTARYYKDDELEEFYSLSADQKCFARGEGLPGTVWETGKTQVFEDLANNKSFVRRQAASKTNLKNAYGIPIHFNTEVIGVLVLGTSDDQSGNIFNRVFFETFNHHLGTEIRRKQLEQELNRVFNFAPDIICIAGVDGYFKKVNPAMVNLMEYSELEMLNRPFSDFVYPDDRGRTAEELNELHQINHVRYFENRYVTRTGKVKWLSWTSTVASEEGLIFCVAKDITDKKDLEKLLEKVNNLARIGGWEIDLVKGTIYWSDITRDIHEVDAAFIPTLESGISFYKEGESRDFIIDRVKDAIEKGISWDVELQIVTAKGNVRWVRVIGEAEMVNNRCVRVYGSFQDIDARKKAEISVTKVLEERNTILESIGDGFFAVDKNWTITYWNNMAEKVVGLTKEKVLGRYMWDIFREGVGSKSYKLYHEAMAKAKIIHFDDYYDPLKMWFELSAYPADGGLAIYFKDVTARHKANLKLKALNDDLQKQAQELVAINAELEQFAYIASHDLQEPLRMVTSFLNQIERKYNDVLDDKGRQYIHFAVDGAKRMRQIILDLLEFSKIGVTEQNIEPVHLNVIVDEILALYRKQIEEKDAKIEFSNLPVITGSKTPIKQVLQNLISNGLKYQKPDVAPLIVVACAENDSDWTISVSDNGIGIAEAYHEKIFAIFQRLHNKDDYPGTGMGLAIAKKIVENLGGKIWVESQPGTGSTFKFTISKP